MRELGFERVVASVVVTFACMACGSDGSSSSSGTGATTPGTTPAPGAVGSFGGSYRVPVSAELTAAATFDVPELSWTVDGSTATLAYNLPRALVGRSVRVDFSGPYDAATGHATLTGEAGTADCTVTAIDVSCLETMRGLLPLEIDLAVVEKLAAGYPGPASDRAAVATQFAGDPIGIALVDLKRPGVPEPVEPGSGKKNP